MKKITDLNSAIEVATELKNYFDSPFHIIDVHGEGLKIVQYGFILDRNYYHSREGKKMFFTFIKTIHNC